VLQAAPAGELCRYILSDNRNFIHSVSFRAGSNKTIQRIRTGSFGLFVSLVRVQCGCWFVSRLVLKDICDTSKAVEVLLNLSCESREQVDGLVAKAVAAGGSTYDKPEDYGFMYTHSFVDPDGGYRSMSI
jgi:hypothetical protein